jgi:acyl-CoA synthetase (NDP forming)
MSSNHHKLDSPGSPGSHTSPHSLHSLFNPAAIALVGATERSIWTASTLENLQRFGFRGTVHLVNQKGETVRGQSAATSCTSLDARVDAALLMVPAHAAEQSIMDIAQAGIRNAVMLTSGFSEAGIAGAAIQTRITQTCLDNNIRLLGPNSLGFVNFHGGPALWTVPVRRARRPGRLALVSQSGAMADEMNQFAHRQGVGIGFMVSTGNEADIDVAEVIDFLVHDASVKCIAVFLETVRHPHRFRAAVRRAHQADKPVVVLKVGRSAASSRIAQTHTGAMVGNDAVFDAVCRTDALLRVTSLEDLVLTADLLARVPRIGPGGLAMGALSGGLCELASDRAHDLKLSTPELSAATVERLRSAMPAFANPHNPLDVTGAALLNPILLRDALSALSQDPHMALTAFVLDAPSRDDPAAFRSQAITAIAEGLSEAGKPSLVTSNMLSPLTNEAQSVLDRSGIIYFSGGVDRALIALSHAFRWHRADVAPVLATQHSHVNNESPRPTNQVPRPTTERDILTYLADFGVPPIPATLCLTAQQSATAAQKLGGLLALKIAAINVAHKSEIGGVMLNVPASQAAAAHAELIQQVHRLAPTLSVDGVWVSPMRSGGIELVVGLVRDPQWGWVLSLGLGGVWVEILNDVALRVLPVDRAAVLAMLSELKCARILDGYRSGVAADRQFIADTVCRIAEATATLGDDLLSLEINPLWVSGNHIEALDGLVQWRPPHALPNLLHR